MIINKYFVDKLNFNQKKAIIFGKGSSFKKVERDDGVLFICVNNTINIIDGDILVVNDIETFDTIDIESLKKETLKYIIVPNHPHKDHKPNKDITYLDIVKNIIYKGDFIIYNLKTWKIPNNDFITLKSCLTGSNTALEWLVKFTNIKEIETYGIGDEEYHQLFKKNILPLVSPEKSNLVKNDFIKVCEENGIKLYIN
jgi:hypothetical protein